MSTSADAVVRIGDAEREAAAASMGDHFAAGRLTRDELDDRLDQVWAARTRGDLEPLFADLPPAGGGLPVEPRQAVRRRDRQHLPRHPATRAPARRRVPRLLPIMIFAVLVLSLTGGGVPWPLLLVGIFVLLKVTRGCGQRAAWAARH